MVSLNKAATIAPTELAPRPLVSDTLYDPTFGSIEDLAGLLIQAVMQDGGGTFHMGQHNRPTSGYAVAVPYCEMVLSEIPPMQVIETWLDSVVRPHAGANVTYVGVWQDKETGRVYFDAVAMIHDAERAEGLGRTWRQKAIFDIAGNAEIRL